MRRSVVASLWSAGPAFLAGPALAEVCDKVDPSWNSAEGPVSSVDFVIDMASSPLGILLLGSVVLATGFRWRWLPFISAALAALIACLIVWVGQEDIYAAAIAEGCLASPIPGLAVLAGIAALMLWLGVVRLRRASSTDG